MFQKVAASQEKLEQMSYYDVLTNILNRMGLDWEIAEWLEKNPKGKGALISLDFDGFKFINELYSHMAGDEALRTMARDLREHFCCSHNLQIIASNLYMVLSVSKGKGVSRILFVNKAMVALFDCKDVSEFIYQRKCGQCYLQLRQGTC